MTLSKTNHPGIYSHPSGSYRVVVTLGGGKQRKATAPTLAEAKRIQAELRTLASDGIVVHGTHTVRSYFETVWSDRIDDTVRKSTANRYRAAMHKHFLCSPIGNTRLRDLTAPEIRKVQDALSKKMQRGSVETTMATLRSMLSSACEDGLMSVNPAKSVKPPPKPANRDKAKVRALSDAEVTSFFEHVPAAYELFFRTLLLTGMRRSEIVAVRWCDLESDRIHIKRAWVLGEMTPPKSGKSRVVPISADLYAALTLHHKASNCQQPDDLIFATLAGLPVNVDWLAKMVLNPTFIKAGIKSEVQAVGDQRIGYHCFRHTAVSTWLRSPLDGGYGWSLKDASRVAGHSSTVITESTYWHFFGDELPTVPSMPTREAVTA